MKIRSNVLLLTLGACCVVSQLGCTSRAYDPDNIIPPYVPPDRGALADAGTASEQGQRLVTALGCQNCHQDADPAAGTLSGNSAAVNGVYAPNLTPDRDTGIGDWTPAQITAAFRTGVDNTGASLCATMPKFSSLSDAEAATIVAYLLDLPPVHHPVPENTGHCRVVIAPDGGVVDAGSIPDAGQPDAGETSDAGETDAGFPGSLTVQSSHNAMPPAQEVNNPAVLAPGGAGPGAPALALGRVLYTTLIQVSSDPCPLPFVSGTKTYCDGFNAVDAHGNKVVVDTFTFLGTSPPCKAQLPPTGTYAAIRGVWDTTFVNSKPVWVLAPTECADLGLGASTNGTGTAPATSEVHGLLNSFSPGAVVTVHGVVTALHESTKSFTLTVQDPAGGPTSAILVYKRKASPSTAVAPARGDYVTITGTAWTFSSGVRGISL